PAAQASNFRSHLNLVVHSTRIRRSRPRRAGNSDLQSWPAFWTGLQWWRSHTLLSARVGVPSQQAPLLRSWNDRGGVALAFCRGVQLVIWQEWHGYEIPMITMGATLFAPQIALQKPYKLQRGRTSTNCILLSFWWGRRAVGGQGIEHFHDKSRRGAVS